ncbi:MAG: glycosyltransferase family 4 protein, partial [Chloroflexota bacterium]
VDLLTYHVGDEVDFPGLAIHRIPSIPFVTNVKPGPSWAKLLLDFFVLIKAVLMLLRNDYEVIHSHEEASFFAAFLARIFRVRHVYDMHSSLPLQLINFRFGNIRPLIWLFQLLEKRVLTTCDAVITIGADLEDLVRRINPGANVITIENLPLQNIVQAPGSGSVEQVSNQLALDSKSVVLYTGNLASYQGLDLLVDSAQIVNQHLSNVLFLLVGGNQSQVNYWREVVAERELADTVLLTGTVPLDEAISYLELCDILVSPRLDGTSIPLKLYTYLSSGKPVVATRTDGHTQILNDDLAVLTEPAKDEFAEGILELLQHPQRGSNLGKRAQVFMKEHYRFDTYVDALEGTYRSLNASHDSEHEEPFPAGVDTDITVP